MQAFLEFLALFMRQYWWAILGVLILWNANVYSLYTDDKRRALAGERTHSERHLLGAAFWGGAIGAIAACMKTRHKTQKNLLRTSFSK